MSLWVNLLNFDDMCVFLMSFNLVLWGEERRGFPFHGAVLARSQLKVSAFASKCPSYEIPTHLLLWSRTGTWSRRVEVGTLCYIYVQKEALACARPFSSELWWGRVVVAARRWEASSINQRCTWPERQAACRFSTISFSCSSPSALISPEM